MKIKGGVKRERKEGRKRIRTKRRVCAKGCVGEECTEAAQCVSNGWRFLSLVSGMSVFQTACPTASLGMWASQLYTRDIIRHNVKPDILCGFMA